MEIEPEERMDGIAAVLTTVPDVETGERIARELVEARLAACVNMVPSVRSFYWWDGAVQDDGEALLIAKVREDQLAAYEERMRAIHPYDVPEVVALSVASVSEPYLRWALREGTPPATG